VIRISVEILASSNGRNGSVQSELANGIYLYRDNNLNESFGQIRSTEKDNEDNTDKYLAELWQNVFDEVDKNNK
jgi:cAMP phosphodiesterase